MADVGKLLVYFHARQIKTIRFGESLLWKLLFLRKMCNKTCFSIRTKSQQGFSNLIKQEMEHANASILYYSLLKPRPEQCGPKK